MSATADEIGAPGLVGRKVTAKGRWLRAVVRRPSGAVGAALVAVVAVAGAVGPEAVARDPLAVDGPSLASPSWTYPMGTDALGRDLLSGVLHGLRTSVLVALAVALAVIAIGMVVGMVAGYRTGRVDDIAMRATEFVQVIPRFFLAIVVVALFGAGIDRLVIVLGLTSWPLLARVVRAEVLSLREREFVDAARADGASSARIIVRELLPNVMPSTVVTVGLIAAQVMLIEASLSFLGLGDPNVISLGYLASQGQQLLRVAWWASIFPGLAIVVAVLGLNLLGDGITDALGGRR